MCFFSDEPVTVSDESTSIPPIELTNGVKRPLQIESEDGDDIKKIKLTENVNEQKVSSLSNKKNKEEENHINIGKILEKITENNSDDHSYVSNKNNIEKDTSNNHIDDKASNIVTNNQNKSTNDSNKSSDTNNVNNCEPVISKTMVNSTESVNTNENVYIQDGQITNDNSLQIKMPSVNLGNQDKNKISLLTEKLEVNNKFKLLNNNSLTKESEINIENGKKKSVQLSSNMHRSITGNTNETMMESVNDHNNYTALEGVSNNNDNDCVFIESDYDSDIDVDVTSVDSFLNESKKFSKKSFPLLLKLFSQKNLTYEVRQ